MVNTSRTESALDDLETTAFTKHHVGSWDPYVFEDNVSVSVRSIHVAVDTQHSLDGDTWEAGWNKDDRLLAVGVLVFGV